MSQVRVLPGEPLFIAALAGLASLGRGRFLIAALGRGRFLIAALGRGRFLIAARAGIDSLGLRAIDRCERHESEKTLLHAVVRDELEPFLARARAVGAPVARFVEREIRAYLNCGVLAHGFLRVHCNGCGHDRVVAFSCKGRGFSPSCGGRRMADTAAHLVDSILPEVPIRQWVLTLPYPLRYRCAWNARLTSDLLRHFLRAVLADQRRRAKRNLGIRGGVCGSVTFIQRFGSALNLTRHFHTLVLDGFYTGTASEPGPFAAIPPPETEDVARVLAGTARRILRRLERSRVETDEDPIAADDPLMAMLGNASIRSRIATGPEAGKPWRRLGDRVEPVGEEVVRIRSIGAVENAA